MILVYTDNGIVALLSLGDAGILTVSSKWETFPTYTKPKPVVKLWFNYR